MSYTYSYPRPAVTVDCVIFGLDDSQELRVLLVQRRHDPYKDHWALPGGFVEMDEDLETAARRELEEETGVRDIFIEQLYTFGDPQRDPRGRVISVAYYALVNLQEHPIQAASDAMDVQWARLSSLPHLAFDHAQVLRVAVERLKAKVRYQPIGFELLPEKFTLSQLEKLYEKILGKPVNKRNFRSKILKMGILEQLEQQKEVAHRPAFLYRFNETKYEQLTQEGFVFEL